MMFHYLRSSNKKTDNMKRVTFSLLASGILFFSACTNEGSSTVATHDDEETTTPAKEQEHEATNGERDQTSIARKDTLSGTLDSGHAAKAVDSTHKGNQH
jgi:hypothetical protein